jgi:hypothetical protein
MDLDGDKLYTKLLTFNEIYNFVVQFFSICSHLGAQITSWGSNNLKSYQLFEPTTSNWKNLTTKLISSKAEFMQKIMIFWKQIDPNQFLLKFEMIIYFCRLVLLNFEMIVAMFGWYRLVVVVVVVFNTSKLTHKKLTPWMFGWRC